MLSHHFAIKTAIPIHMMGNPYKSHWNSNISGHISDTPKGWSPGSPGDEVLVHWSDGHWYLGRVRAMPELTPEISVAWDPPYAHWAPERVAEQAVIPRMNQPREVCNFDVALQFVKLETDFRPFFLFVF